MTPDKVEDWRESYDFKQAVYAADKLLDEPYADPDDHARTIARQFNRMIERYDTLTQYHQDLMSEVDRKIENFDHNDIGLCRCSDAPQKCKCYYGGIETAQTIIKLSK